MPELPEVETLKNQLNLYYKSKKIKKISLFNPKPLKSPPTLILALENKKIETFLRKGKYLFVKFENWDNLLMFHLKLTGILCIKKLPHLGKHLVAEILFQEANPLHVYDIRKFSLLKVVSQEEFKKLLKSLGKDALEIEKEEFFKILSSSNRQIKTLLLDQSRISGLGNIYADEILFRSKINPLRRANSLKSKERERLFCLMKDVLKEAIKLRGSSIRDYVDLFGEKGRFQEKHLVYGKKGKPCPVCGTPLMGIKISQRTTTFCPSCQK